MRLKTFTTVLILSLAPMSAFAQCVGSHAEQQAMSCAEGSQWDQVSGTCVPVAST